MLLNERQRHIYEVIKKHKTVSNRTLLESIDMSESTLRRDLSLLEKQGLIHRTHGHSMILESSSKELSIVDRVKSHVKEKNSIGITCANLLSNDESYFIDSSTTAGYVLPHLQHYQNITMITNGLNNAAILAHTPNIRVYIPAGIIYTNTNSVLGIDTSNYIKRFNCHAFIFSCGGISLKSGITEVSLEQSLVKREMLNHSKLHILLVDHSKFDKTFLCQTCNFDVIDIIITNKKPSIDYIQAFEKAHIQLILS